MDTHRDRALKAFNERKERNKTRLKVDNSALPAGSPMFFDCQFCGEIIEVPEDYIAKPKGGWTCHLCGDMLDHGWLRRAS